MEHRTCEKEPLHIPIFPFLRSLTSLAHSYKRVNELYVPSILKWFFLARSGPFTSVIQKSRTTPWHWPWPEFLSGSKCYDDSCVTGAGNAVFTAAPVRFFSFLRLVGMYLREPCNVGVETSCLFTEYFLLIVMLWFQYRIDYNYDESCFVDL